MISVIIPIQNLTDQFNQNLELLKKELEAHFGNFEIIIVHNNSNFFNTSNDSNLIRKNSHIIRINSHIQGKGQALKLGFEHSSGNKIVFLDGDFELHYSDIKNFVALLDLYEVDIVIGSKRHPYSQVNYPAVRRILSFAYQIFIRIFLNLKGVRDSQVGLKLFRREVLEKSMPRLLCKTYAFDLELLTVASHLGYHKILEAPIKLKYGGGFKQEGLKELIHLLKIAWPLLVDTLAIIYRLRILKYYDSKSFNFQETISK